MMRKRLLTEFGLGTSLRRQDYTEASVRGVKNALWHNSINLAELFDRPKSDMLIDVEIGVANPDAVDIAQIEAVFPYGQPNVHVVKGGLDIPRQDGGKPTVMANVAISVSFEMET
ncbi:MAG: Lin0512 family protein [Pelagimonas sp.]|uniref:Lin0512 family protein n=1 Tax=Pelagimonas sp. TaxID=2073170 RepID=UPI003D6A35CD